MPKSIHFPPLLYEGLRRIPVGKWCVFGEQGDMAGADAYDSDLIPTRGIWGQQPDGYLQFCGCRAPVFDGVANLLDNLRRLLSFKHVAFTCGEQDARVRLFCVRVDEQALMRQGVKQSVKGV